MAWTPRTASLTPSFSTTTSNGEPKLVHSGSRCLNDAERNYTVIKTEMLAMQLDVAKYHQFLAGAPGCPVATAHAQAAHVADGRPHQPQERRRRRSRPADAPPRR